MKKQMATNPNSVFQQKLEWLWSLMDISDNMHKVLDDIGKKENDFITSALHCVVFAALTIVALTLAYHFDFQSTLEGISTLQNAVIPNLPSTVQSFSGWISLMFTLAPTLIELFSVSFARAQIKIVQVFVVGLTAFDLITDIPRAASFVDSMQPYFDQLGPIVGWITHAFIFIVWLFLSTIGFELVTILFGLAALVYFLRAFKLRNEVRRSTPFKNVVQAQPIKQQSNKQPTTVTVLDSE